MSRLNEDVLFLMIGEFQNDIKSLHSCLLVNRTWCKATIPVLWKNPYKFRLTNEATNMLLNVILLHLPEESKDILKKNQVINLFVESSQQPSFNYISFWRS